MPACPRVRAFFDRATNSVTYLVADPATGSAAIIDPVLDFEPAMAKVSTLSADALLATVTEQQLTLRWLLETHAHADHLSAAGYLQHRTGAATGIGNAIGAVQAIFRPRFGTADRAAGEGFDRLLADGERLPLGNLEIEVLATPGHTAACVSYRIGDAVFVGDTLFMPDYGTARADFPGGDAATLYRSIRRLLALPPETRLFTGHDYGAPGRADFAWESTVAEQHAHNVHIRDGVDEAAFVALRRSRDATLAPPRLILPSLAVNVEGGRLPAPGPDGIRRLALPLMASEGYADS